MAKLRHAPGPWTVDESQVLLGTQKGDEISDSTGNRVCEVSPLSTKLANACLIAAAPKLLAACVSAREACRENISRADYKNEQVLHTAFLRCCEAIQEAIGK